MSTTRMLVAVLAVLGVLALLGGLIYLLVPAHSLPSFIPGHIAGSSAKHSRRGLGGIVLGVLLLAGAALTARMGGAAGPGRPAL